LGKLEDSVKKSKCVVFILSKSILKSKWCLVELKTALDSKVKVILMQGPDCKFGPNGIRAFPDLDNDEDCFETIEYGGEVIDIRNAIRPAFAHVAVRYDLDYHNASMDNLVQRLGISYYLLFLKEKK
jgi:hypothetical protein